MLTEILGVFTSIGTWFVSIFSTIAGLFYDQTADKLTFVGVITIIGLGIAVILLVINWLKSLMRLR